MASTATAAGRINAVLCQGATERVLGLGKYDTMGESIYRQFKFRTAKYHSREFLKISGQTMTPGSYDDLGRLPPRRGDLRDIL